MIKNCVARETYSGYKDRGLYSERASEFLDIKRWGENLNLEGDEFRLDRLRAPSSSKEGGASWGVNCLNDLPSRLVERFVFSIDNDVSA